MTEETTGERIKRLIGKRLELQQELREVDYRLASEVLDYEGSLQEALLDGLVKLNFAKPRQFERILRERVGGQG